MASFFKFSCVAYWLCFLGCVSYFFGTTIYSSTYIVATKGYDHVFGILEMVCFFNMAMALVGCCFVKCSITHILCAGLYIIPLFCANIALCVMGITEVRLLVPLTAQELVDNIKEVFDKHGLYPEWIYNVQMQMPCCGIYSFLDYPLLFNDKSKNPSSDIILSEIIPKSCCNVSSRHSSTCNLDLDNGPRGVVPSQILDSMQLTCLGMNSSEAPYYSTNRSLHPDLHEKIFPCGCLKDINSITTDLYGAHIIFFVCILLLTFLMGFIYVKLWCSHRGSNVDSGSDHSLDVDEAPSYHRLSSNDLIPESFSVTYSIPEASESVGAVKPSLLLVPTVNHPRGGSTTVPESPSVLIHHRSMQKGGGIPSPKPKTTNVRRVASTVPHAFGKK